MTHYVLGFAFDQTLEQVILIRKRKPEWQAGKLNGVGGKVEDGEDVRTAMVREFREETGATLKTWKFFAVMEFPGCKVWCFTTTVPADFRFNSPTTEKVGSFWSFKIFDREHKAMANLRWLIPMAQNFLTDSKPASLEIISSQ